MNHRTESVFSIAGMLSDSGQDLRHLQVLVRVKSNRAAYDYAWEKFWKKYKQVCGASCEDLEAA